MTFSHFVPPSFESPCQALFRTGLVFTVALTKNIARSQNTAHSISHRLKCVMLLLPKRFFRFFQKLSGQELRIWVLSQSEFWVLSHFEFLRFVTIWIFGFSHSLGFVAHFIFWVVIFSVFEFGNKSSFLIVTFWMFESFTTWVFDLSKFEFLSYV